MHAQQLPPHAAAAAAAHGSLPLMPHPALAGGMPTLPPGAASAAGLLALGGPPGHHMPSVAAAMAAVTSSANAVSASLKDHRANADVDAVSSKRSNSGESRYTVWVETFLTLLSFPQCTVLMTDT